MKKALITLLGILSLSLSFASADGGEEIALTLQVVDALTGMPLIGADVEIGDKVLYTDPDGFIQLTYDPSITNAISIHYISYQDKEVELISRSSFVQIGLSSR